MAQIILGVFLIALAAIMAFYGQQIARDGWTKMYPPSSAMVDRPVAASAETTISSISSVKQTGVTAGIINGPVTINTTATERPNRTVNRDKEAIYQTGGDEERIVKNLPQNPEHIKELEFSAVGTLLQLSGRFAKTLPEIRVLAENSFHFPQHNPNWTDAKFRFPITTLPSPITNSIAYVKIADVGIVNGERKILIGDPSQNLPIFPGQNKISIFFITPDGQEQVAFVEVFHSGSFENNALTIIRKH